MLKKECEQLREEKNNFEMENQHMAADSAMQMSNYNAQMSRMVRLPAAVGTVGDAVLQEAEVKAVREQNQQLLDQVRDKRQLQTRLDEVENKWHAAEAAKEVHLPAAYLLPISLLCGARQRRLSLPSRIR